MPTDPRSPVPRLRSARRSLLGLVSRAGRRSRSPAARRLAIHLGRYLLDTDPLATTAADGRRFLLEFPRDRGYESVAVLGEFETGTTEALSRALRPSDVVFDVGANLGWYTTLFATQCSRGACHAFEPSP